MPRQISAEAQHVIDSLEAHFVGLTKLVENAAPAVTKHIAACWDEALGALEKLGAEFRHPNTVSAMDSALEAASADAEQSSAPSGDGSASGGGATDPLGGCDVEPPVSNT